MMHVNRKKWRCVSTLLCSAVVFIVLISVSSTVRARDDWPQWRGIHRDGISAETGLVKGWDEGGPKILFRLPAGDGYSGVVVSRFRLITMLSEAKTPDEFVVCHSLKMKNKREVWRTRIDSRFNNQFGDGPRSTPSLDGKFVFALSAKGTLAAIDIRDGLMLWQHNLPQEYGAKVPQWGVSTSPLVYEDKLLVDVGGGNGFGFVAFDKETGKVLWKTPTELPGYSAPIAVTVHGQQQVLCLTGNSLISVDPETGRKYWDYPWETSYDVNAATPIFIAPDKVFVSSGYGTGGAVLRIKPQGAGSSREVVWKSKIMRNKFSSSILVSGHLFGFDEATLKCIDVETEETKWMTRGLGKGSLMVADGQLIILGEKGKLVLAEANTSRYVENARAQVLTGKCWTMPTLSNGILYLRNQKEIVAIDLRRFK